MYTSIENTQTNPPGYPDVTRAKMKSGSKVRWLMTIALGREFTALSARYKLYVLYFCLSLMLLFVWDEARIWPNMLNVLNFANAVRLANKTVKGTSAGN